MKAAKLRKCAIPALLMRGSALQGQGDMSFARTPPRRLFLKCKKAQGFPANRRIWLPAKKDCQPGSVFCAIMAHYRSSMSQNFNSSLLHLTPNYEFDSVSKFKLSCRQFFSFSVSLFILDNAGKKNTYTFSIGQKIIADGIQEP